MSLDKCENSFVAMNLYTMLNQVSISMKSKLFMIEEDSGKTYLLTI